MENNTLLFQKVEKEHPDLQGLIRLLDQELAVLDGEEHDFYDQFNGLESIHHLVIAVVDQHAIACGAFKKMNEKAVEIKRMYVKEQYRGKGIAGQLLSTLEEWASAEGYMKSMLETGRRQQPAIRLYEKHGYNKIPNYGQYKGMENSICFEKVLTKT